MRRTVVLGAVLALLLGLGMAVPAQADPPGRSGEPSAKELCDSYLDTRDREIPPGSGNMVPFTAYWVPMAYPPPIGVDDLPILNKAGCITTVLAGGKVEPVPFDALSTTAINAQCKYLEATGIEYPYEFYGNPDYYAKNRSDCIYFLRAFHLGELEPGAPA